MQDKDLYTIAVMRYKEENPNIKDEYLFPMDFNLSSNYHLKVDIIAEAIQKKILVVDTELYKNNFIKNKYKILENKK